MLRHVKSLHPVIRDSRPRGNPVMRQRRILRDGGDGGYCARV